MKKVEKPWGYELWFAQTDKYVGKILHINAGQRLSLQYHKVKDETIYIAKGHMQFELGPNKDSLKCFDLHEGDSIRTEPGMVHRMIAVTDVDVFEVSTPEVEDVVRLEDVYGRAPVKG